MNAHPFYTIGHSSHPFEHFVGLLRDHGIEVVADVRSVPASARHPQYGREALKAALARCGIEYVFVGKELGARRTEREAYEEGVATYERIARLPAFRVGLDRVKESTAGFRVALMCAEKAPLDCHRALLVCRHLREEIAGIQHILADGRLESHAHLERLLVAGLRMNATQPDMFSGETESPLELAYRRRGREIAYREKAGRHAPTRAAR